MLARPLSVTTAGPACWRNACIITVNAPPLEHGTIRSSAARSDSESSPTKRYGIDVAGPGRVRVGGLAERQQVAHARAQNATHATSPRFRSCASRAIAAARCRRRRRSRRSTGGWPLSQLGGVDVDLRRRAPFGTNCCQLKPGLLQPQPRAERDERRRPAAAARWPRAGPRCWGARSTAAASAGTRSAPFHVVITRDARLLAARAAAPPRRRARRRRRAAAPAARAWRQLGEQRGRVGRRRRAAGSAAAGRFVARSRRHRRARPGRRGRARGTPGPGRPARCRRTTALGEHARGQPAARCASVVTSDRRGDRHAVDLLDASLAHPVGGEIGALHLAAEDEQLAALEAGRRPPR